MESSPLHSYLNRSLFIPSRITGLLLVITGIFFLYNPNDLRLKVGVTLILFGLFSLLLVNIKEESVTKVITGWQLTLILTLWIFLGFVITNNIDAETFIIIVILGVLIIIEFLSDFLSPLLEKRKTLLFYLLIIAFVIIIEQSIIHRVY